MSAIVSGIVNSTIGLLCNKLRDYTAGKLNEGDINDSQLRQIIVREIDDITTKLDGLSRKDLLASLSFFKEGVTELYISLETCGESCKKPSASQAHTDDEPEGAPSKTREQFPVKTVEGDAIDTISDIHKFIGNLKVASKKRYKSAEKSFQEAKRLATEAFHNTALSTEDRVMAGQLRIASRILGCLDDPEAAVQNCLLYLKELQDLPAIQAIFTVWRKKRFSSRLRARFNQVKRNDLVESIQAITGLLLHLTLQHTNMMTNCLNWPTINIGKEIYEPVKRQKEIMQQREKRKYTKAKQDPWRFQTDARFNDYDCAVTSKGEILSTILHEDALLTSESGTLVPSKDRLEITKPNGECSLFCTIPSENDGDILNKVCCFAVDENDNVYIVIEIPSCYENVQTQYKLLTFDENGKAIADRALDIIEELKSPQMSVTKDGKLVIYCDRIKSMYICDSTNAEKEYKFPLPLKNVCPEDIKELSFTVSDQNEIIYTFVKQSDDESFVMNIITMDGELKHEVKVPATTDWVLSMNVVFNHENKTILVSLCNDNDDSSATLTDTSFFSFSKNGELLNEFEIPGWEFHQLTSHSRGPIALVDRQSVTMLQM